MKKTKILTVLGVLLAMGITACGGGGNKPAPSSNPESSQSGGEQSSQGGGEQSSQGGGEQSSQGGGDSSEEVPPAHVHDFSEGAEKTDVLEEAGSVVEEMYKCKGCDVYSIRWSALDYDVDKTTERSTKKPESRDSGKAIRFDNTVNYQGQDTTKKGCHIVYNVYIPEAVEHVKLATFSSRRTDINTIFDMAEGDTAKGYEYVPQAEGDPVLQRPASRYGLKVDGQVIILPADDSGQTWKDGNNWYTFPGELAFAQAGVHEIEIYNLGGYRAEFYNFALVGFGPHEHVDNYKVTDAKTNADGKIVKLGVDSFTGKKAAMIDMNQISGAYASEKTSADGEPEAFGLGAEDTAFKAADTYKLDKGKVIAFKVDLSAAVTGAKIEVGAEFSNALRYFYNMAIRGNETMTDNNADKTTEDAWRYYVKVNDGAFQPMGCEETMQSVLDASAGKYMPLGTFDLQEGSNMIYIRQGNIGYRVTMDNPLRVVFSGDATIVGDHAHLFTEVVSETDPTCTEPGKKVVKCVCGETTEVVGAPALGHGEFTKGDAVQNSKSQNVTPIECPVCHAKGFEMGLKDCDGASNIASDGKVGNGKELVYTFKVGESVGQVQFLMNAMLNSAGHDNPFSDGGTKGNYTLKAGNNTGTVTAAGKQLGANFGATDTTSVWFEMGRVSFTADDLDANGEIAISIKFPTTQDYRHKYAEGVRIVYLPAQA